MTWKSPVSSSSSSREEHSDVNLVEVAGVTLQLTIHPEGWRPTDRCVSGWWGKKIPSTRTPPSTSTHPPTPPPTPPPALVSSQHLSLCLCQRAPLSLSSSPPPTATRRITKVVECDAVPPPPPPPLNETREQVQKHAAGVKLSRAHSD